MRKDHVPKGRYVPFAFSEIGMYEHDHANLVMLDTIHPNIVGAIICVNTHP